MLGAPALWSPSPVPPRGPARVVLTGDALVRPQEVVPAVGIFKKKISDG